MYIKWYYKNLENSQQQTMYTKYFYKWRLQTAHRCHYGSDIVITNSESISQNDILIV